MAWTRMAATTGGLGRSSDWTSRYGYGGIGWDMSVGRRRGCEVRARGNRGEWKRFNEFWNIGDIGRTISSGLARKGPQGCRSRPLCSNTHTPIRAIRHSHATPTARIHSCHANLPDHLPSLHSVYQRTSTNIQVLAVDLLNRPAEVEARTHKLKKVVPEPNSFFMDVKCPGCFQITDRKSVV